MKRNKSFSKTPFYFVATPIGNLSEFTPRAIEVLQNVDFICAEDTRTSGLLLHHFNIKKPLISVHKFNEASKLDLIINKLQNAETGAFLSDAGYPLISDPGSVLVNALLSNDIFISVINGPSAFLPALLGSGLATDTFTFIGFLSGNNKEVNERLLRYKERSETLLIYEAPHRLTKTIALLYNVFGERKLTIARELTKMHEEYIYTSLQEYSENPLTDIKGEIVLVIEGNTKTTSKDIDTYVLKVHKLIKEQNYSLKEAVKIIALVDDVNRNELYEAYLKRS